MTRYRRFKIHGGCYFFTAVTYKRRDLFNDRIARDSLRKAWKNVQRQHPFEVTALCLLPDHIHTVWLLPEDDFNFSLRWQLIKKGFSRNYIESGGIELNQSISRQNKGERGFWQRRFWEHHIRNEQDLEKHVDYIHYNPVKHALVKNVSDWPWSTYHKFAKLGFYNDDIITEIEGNFGEK